MKINALLDFQTLIGADSFQISECHLGTLMPELVLQRFGITGGLQSGNSPAVAQNVHCPHSVRVPGRTPDTGTVKSITDNTETLTSTNRENPLGLRDFRSVAVALHLRGKTVRDRHLTGLRALAQNRDRPTVAVSGQVTRSRTDCLRAAQRAVEEEFN